VLALPPPFDPVPTARYALPRPESCGDAPEGARLVDDIATPDGMDHAFTLDQTDSNQHVNSLVYIQLFLEAAQRRFAARGMPLVRRSREVEIAYRKPCFAGDQVRVYLRAFEVGELTGAAGYVAGTDGKPRCYVRTVFGS